MARKGKEDGGEKRMKGGKIVVRGEEEIKGRLRAAGVDRTAVENIWEILQTVRQYHDWAGPERVFRRFLRLRWTR